MHKVYFGCETVQLRYIIDKLSASFNNLTPTALEKSEFVLYKDQQTIKGSKSVFKQN
jgi:hypothetical protein